MESLPNRASDAGPVSTARRSDGPDNYEPEDAVDRLMDVQELSRSAIRNRDERKRIIMDMIGLLRVAAEMTDAEDARRRRVARIQRVVEGEAS